LRLPDYKGFEMPQIWMTYEELAGMLDCSVAEVRELILLQQLDRKLSRDGKKRVKLSVDLVSVFIYRVKADERSLDRAITDLRQAHRFMSGASVGDDYQDQVENPVARRGAC
jgi:hypothetical protein